MAARQQVITYAQVELTAHKLNLNQSLDILVKYRFFTVSILEQVNNFVMQSHNEHNMQSKNKY